MNLDDLIEDLPALRERIRRNRSDPESGRYAYHAANIGGLSFVIARRP